MLEAEVIGSSMRRRPPASRPRPGLDRRGAPLSGRGGPPAELRANLRRHRLGRRIGEAARPSTRAHGLGYRDDREVYHRSEGARSIFDRPESGTSTWTCSTTGSSSATSSRWAVASKRTDPRSRSPSCSCRSSRSSRSTRRTSSTRSCCCWIIRSATGDAETIDVDRIARLAAADWGLWRTLTQNLEKVVALAAATRSSTPRSGPRREAGPTAEGAHRRRTQADVLADARSNRRPAPVVDRRGRGPLTAQRPSATRRQGALEARHPRHWPATGRSDWTHSQRSRRQAS